VLVLIFISLRVMISHHISISNNQWFGNKKDGKDKLNMLKLNMLKGQQRGRIFQLKTSAKSIYPWDESICSKGRISVSDRGVDQGGEVGDCLLLPINTVQAYWCDSIVSTSKLDKRGRKAPKCTHLHVKFQENSGSVTPHRGGYTLVRPLSLCASVLPASVSPLPLSLSLRRMSGRRSRLQELTPGRNRTGTDRPQSFLTRFASLAAFPHRSPTPKIYFDWRHRFRFRHKSAKS